VDGERRSRRVSTGTPPDSAGPYLITLDDLKIASIDKIPNFGVLAKLVKEMKEIHSHQSGVSAA
jgi:hypothetical protein